MRRILAAALTSLVITGTADVKHALAQADVILGELAGPRVYARSNGIAALSVGTTSCNAGDTVLQWKALPSNRHPVITMNMYRLLDGRMTQIGQGWLKHGFTALQQDICNFGCQSNPGGDGLGVGCSDPYGASLNQGPRLGSRGHVNPTTGAYDGPAVLQALNGFQPGTPIDHGLQVSESDLAVSGARYFIEGHYVAPDDAVAGQGDNNVSHMEVAVSRNEATGAITLAAVGATQREIPAIRAWPFANFEVRSAFPDDGRIVIAHRVLRLSRTVHRYEYAIYNMNSERGVRSFSVDVGNAPVSNLGFAAVRSHGDPWSNAPWQGVIANGKVTWSTARFEDDRNANAIRWGTTYNFWFDAQAMPKTGQADVGKFKPGQGAGSISVAVQVPRS